MMTMFWLFFIPSTIVAFLRGAVGIFYEVYVIMLSVMLFVFTLFIIAAPFTLAFILGMFFISVFFALIMMLRDDIIMLTITIWGFILYLIFSNIL